MKTTLTDTAIRNYLVVIAINDKEWMAFVQLAHYDETPKEIGRFYWYHKYPITLTKTDVMKLAIRDLLDDMEAVGT